MKIQLTINASQCVFQYSIILGVLVLAQIIVVALFFSKVVSNIRHNEDWIHCEQHISNILLSSTILSVFAIVDLNSIIPQSRVLQALLTRCSR